MLGVDESHERRRGFVRSGLKQQWGLFVQMKGIGETVCANTGMEELGSS